MSAWDSGHNHDPGLNVATWIIFIGLLFWSVMLPLIFAGVVR